jgi:uncharacterized protein (TIGR02646 family)
MCSGIERCMYCEDSAATDIDHFEPLALAPKRAFTWSNYLAACSGCNSNYKRDEFPLDAQGRPLLLEPTQDDPTEHLEFSPTTGFYTPVSQSSKASESIRVFRLNRPGLATGRRAAWEMLQLGIIAYAQAADDRDFNRANRMALVVGLQPYAGVLRAILMAADRVGEDVILPEARAAILKHPELRDWPQILFGASSNG